MKKGDVAVKAGYSRSAYYKHVAQPDLKFHILVNYGKALKYDFTEEFPEMSKYSLHDSGSDEPRTIGDALKQRDEIQRKYNELLEKYNVLLEEKLAPALAKRKK